MKYPKLIILLIVLLCFKTNIYSQEIVTKAEYTFYSNLNSNEILRNAILYFNNNKSLFSYDKLKNQKSSEIANDEQGNYIVKIDNRDSIGSYQYITSKKIYERRLHNKKYYLLEDDIEKPQWELIDSTKTIGKYLCDFAKTKLYGREYYAWYTTQIPSPKGPWKLNGLSGLILYSSTTNNNVVFELLKIKFDEKFYFPQKNEKNITIKEFFIKKNTEMNKFKKFFKSINKEGVDVNFEIKDEELEKLKFDEE